MPLTKRCIIFTSATWSSRGYFSLGKGAVGHFQEGKSTLWRAFDRDTANVAIVRPWNPKSNPKDEIYQIFTALQGDKYGP